jgi:multiple sugar transport system permease protein
VTVVNRAPVTAARPPLPAVRGERPAARLRRGLAPALVYASLLLASLVMVVPVVVVLFTSLKSPSETLTTSPLTPPRNWFDLHNFAVAFRDGRMLEGFANTAFILVVSVTGTVLIGSMTAYALDRFSFRGRRVVVGAFLLAALVPSVTTQVTTFRVIDFFGLYNTRWSAIVLYVGTDIVSIYIFLQMIRAIPTALDEAARIDGAGPWTIYWRIILPNLKPAVATVVIVKGITVYNDFYIPFLYMPDKDLGTISTSLFRFKGPFGASWEAISAGTILVIVPTLIVFLALQRYIYNGFAAGSVK